MGDTLGLRLVRHVCATGQWASLVLRWVSVCLVCLVAAFLNTMNWKERLQECLTHGYKELDLFGMPHVVCLSRDMQPRYRFTNRLTWRGGGGGGGGWREGEPRPHWGSRRHSAASLRGGGGGGAQHNYQRHEQQTGACNGRLVGRWQAAGPDSGVRADTQSLRQALE